VKRASDKALRSADLLDADWGRRAVLQGDVTARSSASCGAPTRGKRQAGEFRGLRRLTARGYKREGASSHGVRR